MHVTHVSDSSARVEARTRIRQHTSAYSDSLTSAYVRILGLAYVSIRQRQLCKSRGSDSHTSAYVSDSSAKVEARTRIRQHTSAYSDSHTSAYVRILGLACVSIRQRQLCKSRVRVKHPRHEFSAILKKQIMKKINSKIK
jgi:hypothetical protein